MQATEIRLILGDQLNSKHSWFSEVSKDVLYVLMEIRPESEYVTHHIQKIVGIFHAMRTFKIELEEAGHRVKYFSITDIDNKHSFKQNLAKLLTQTGALTLCYQEADEWRLDRQLDEDFSDLGVELIKCSSEHFYLERNELSQFLKQGGNLMESFYRKLRKKFNVLMDMDQPVTGQWNYDQSNRKKLPKGTRVPRPLTFGHDVSSILDDIQSAELPSIGKIQPRNFHWPKNRSESSELLDFFIAHLLPQFGDYQDAMSKDEWSVFHSRLSFSMNVKMISPREIVEAVEKAWKENPGRIHIAQAEGFIRQILGWREYMRGIYWIEMPEFSQMNFFNHNRKLPDYFWTGNTKIQCLKSAIGQSLEHAYAHHIQRLMVTGNFSLLTGIHPDEMDAWYLGIYIDAFEWVEMPNTRGMSQFADGGIVGTKPYISSASYINKMSDYCGSCPYDHRKKHGDKACPFNSLYWNFLDQHRDKLSQNPRMTMMYSVLDKMDSAERTKLITQANTYLYNIEKL